MNELLIRSARPEDLDFAFEMTVEAGHGLIERFLGCGTKEYAYNVFKSLWTGSLNRFHYSHAKIAESGNEKCGFLVAYLVNGEKSNSLDIIQIIKVGGTRLLWYYLSHIKELHTAFSLPEGKTGEYYISSVAAVPGERGKGIGTLLLNEALKTGKEMNANKISLVVARYNEGAIKLYRNLGFNIDHSEDTKEYYRMVMKAGSI